jgi:ssDNA-binding Zn-finger/Zn-ribbon topoisomerase 1
MTKTKVICPECEAPMVLRWTDKYKRHFYSCSRWPECDAAHGADPQGKPLGIPANKATKRARIAAHDAFDLVLSQLEPTSGEALVSALRFGG